MTASAFRKDYVERVYAGVLGKIIGVYLGRPIEGWSYESIMNRLGEIHYYINQHPNHPQKPPLIVTDDDISGTFGFFRALEDHGYTKDLTAEQVGNSWLNYIIEGKTVLWWGGMGMSTEHTAFVRLKNGIKAPRSGSIALNGPVVAEQIGAQIFIDAWGMCCPGDPAQAAKLARAAGSVSHDGEAVHGAVIVATLVAQAFVEKDLNKMLDTSLTFIPKESVIARMIGEIRAWVKQDGDWRKTRERIVEHYGYDKFGGNCHMVPNHALIILALLYAPDDFSEALKIVNTCGWDTDCNSANVGCIMGVRLGLDALQKSHDWRGPVADRLFIPTAEGSRALSDAVIETDAIVRSATRMNGGKYTAPKNGARWHFSYRGSVQGWAPLLNELGAPTCGVASTTSPFNPSEHCLAISLTTIAALQTAGVAVNTWFLPEEINMPGYGCIGNPVLYAGQTVVADVMRQPSTPGMLQARFAVTRFGADDKPEVIRGPWQSLEPGKRTQVTWQVPDMAGLPIYQLRMEFSGDAAFCTVFADSVRIKGVPKTALLPTDEKVTGKLWQNIWVNGLHAPGRNGIWRNNDTSVPHDRVGLWVTSDSELGNISIGAFDWAKYRFSANIHLHLADQFGIAVGYRGLKRLVRLLLDRSGQAVLEQLEMDGTKELARVAYPCELYKQYAFAIDYTPEGIRCSINGMDLFGTVTLAECPAGGVGVCVSGGRVLLLDARIE